MNSNCPFYILSFYFLLIICCTTIVAQQTAPSEQDLSLILHQLQEKNNFQQLKIGGMVKGFFTKKDQLDYVIWLNELEIAAPEEKRQIIKLSWSVDSAAWLIACIAKVPAGIIINKEHFVDITGDEVLEVLCNYSYSKQNCVDGCIALSLKDTCMQIFYAQAEEQDCKNIDSTLLLGTELPYVTYKLKYHKEKKKLLVYRYVKKYNGGKEHQDIIKQALLDSTLTSLEYFSSLKLFGKPWVIPCDSLALEDNILDERHPAVRLALQQLNKNQASPFYIEGVYQASFSQKNKTDYLFYSNIFTTANKLQKRKAIKVICNGLDWKVAGTVYLPTDFSLTNIQDVDGDGLSEIVEEFESKEKQQCFKNYQLFSLKGPTTKLLYSHKNNIPCDAEIVPDSIEEYIITFEDIDYDGIKELVRHSTSGKLVFKYDDAKEVFVEIP